MEKVLDATIEQLTTLMCGWQVTGQADLGFTEDRLVLYYAPHYLIRSRLR